MILRTSVATCIFKIKFLIFYFLKKFNNNLPSHVNYKHRFEVGIAVVWYLGITDMSHSINLGSLINNNSHTTLMQDECAKQKLKSYTDTSLIPKKYRVDRNYYENHDMNQSIYPLNLESTCTKQQHFLMKNESYTSLLKNVFSTEFSPGLAGYEMLKSLPDAYFIIDM